jgi:hypothetical protein
MGPPIIFPELAGKICQELATLVFRKALRIPLNLYAVFFKGNADKSFGVYL